MTTETETRPQYAPGDVVQLVSVTGRIGTDGNIHLPGHHAPLDPATVPSKLLYGADHARNDPMLTIRRDPGSNPDNPHARRVIRLPGGSPSYPWLTLYQGGTYGGKYEGSEQVDSDTINSWPREDIVIVVVRMAKHRVDDPGCARCYPPQETDPR